MLVHDYNQEAFQDHDGHANPQEATFELDTDSESNTGSWPEIAEVQDQGDENVNQMQSISHS